MKAGMVICAFAVAVLLVVGGPILRAQSATNETPLVRVAPPAPQFELSDFYGRTVKLSSCTTTAVIVSFVLADDPPSQRQLDELTRLRAAHSREALGMFAIVLDNRPNELLRERFVALERGIQFLRYDLSVIEGFGGLTAAPTTFVLDVHRNIIGRHVGLTGADQLEPELRAILRP
ncbi:MAG: redoxin domain-containing protein [Verrucomicrobiae bacterium]|nr:redoxin domain-containing protein [Verrucomicrobiae bacterium]